VNILFEIFSVQAAIGPAGGGVPDRDVFSRDRNVGADGSDDRFFGRETGGKMRERIAVVLSVGDFLGAKNTLQETGAPALDRGPDAVDLDQIDPAA